MFLWVVNNSKETGKDRETVIDMMPESLHECFYYWPEECEIVCRSGFANVNIVFLICLMFIFQCPIQITLFQIHLVSVIKFVTCQVHYWISYWCAWMDKQRQHSLWSISTVLQQYLCCVMSLMLITWAERHWVCCHFLGLPILHSGRLVCGNM